MTNRTLTADTCAYAVTIWPWPGTVLSRGIVRQSASGFVLRLSARSVGVFLAVPRTAVLKTGRLKLTATFRTYALTGVAATFTRPRKITATKATYAVSQPVANRQKYGRKSLAAAVLAVVLTGRALALRFGRQKLAAGKRDLILTRVAASFKRGRTMRTATATFLLWPRVALLINRGRAV